MHSPVPITSFSNFSLVGASHTSITDASLIGGPLTGSFGGSGFNATIEPQVGVEQYVKSSFAFLNYITKGTRDHMLPETVTHPQYGVANETALQSAPEEIKNFWQVHVSPNLKLENTLNPGFVGLIKISSTSNNASTASEEASIGMTHWMTHSLFFLTVSLMVARAVD
jgi:hypothetical protein